jgi:hypothetical protein
MDRKRAGIWKIVYWTALYKLYNNMDISDFERVSS